MFLYDQYPENKQRDKIGSYIARFLTFMIKIGALSPLICGLLLFLLGINLAD
jgi:hypothetical protein